MSQEELAFNCEHHPPHFRTVGGHGSGQKHHKKQWIKHPGMADEQVIVNNSNKEILTIRNIGHM